ncbi:P-loop containing nucleoside triphosphate hydrolase protein [Mycena sanguinolenta]|uniref:P-loop containing nucleoside triphosphate hydrolase protein n=1 Tax=Mycena sanguinolenta TaxID=230812 RepID=A0A8H6X702_9AGAR|nr:P-loop containing nucleoside triphosphate hydrolase protein [Mycena sanguinolenta]
MSNYDSMYRSDSLCDDPSLEDGAQDDIIIAVMGCTGSGNPPFVDPTSGRTVTIVDTPGFDDSRPEMTDTDILKQIADFLCKRVRFSSAPFVQGEAQAEWFHLRPPNLRYSVQWPGHPQLADVQKLCGPEIFKNVVILTTFWDQAGAALGQKREAQLMQSDKIFKDLVAKGAHSMRHDQRTRENALQVLRHISALKPKDPRIAKEIVDERKHLEDTAAGSVRREEVKRLIAKHEEEVKKLKEEMQRSNEKARRELEEQRAELMEKLARFEGEAVELKKGLDDERQLRQQREEEAEKEAGRVEARRDAKERELASRLDSQAKAHQKSIELQEEKAAKERKDYEARRDAKERALASRLDSQAKAHQKSIELQEEKAAKERKDYEARRDAKERENAASCRRRLQGSRLQGRRLQGRRLQGRWLQREAAAREVAAREAAARERKDYEARRERDWAQAELINAQTAREAVQRADEQRRLKETQAQVIALQKTLNKESNRSFLEGGLRAADAIPLVPSFVGKPILGLAGLALDVFGYAPAKK